MDGVLLTNLKTAFETCLLLNLCFKIPTVEHPLGFSRFKSLLTTCRPLNENYRHIKTCQSTTSKLQNIFFVFSNECHPFQKMCSANI